MLRKICALCEKRTVRKNVNTLCPICAEALADAFEELLEQNRNWGEE